jgi:hypothetical protein
MMSSQFPIVGAGFSATCFLLSMVAQKIAKFSACAHRVLLKSDPTAPRFATPDGQPSLMSHLLQEARKTPRITIPALGLRSEKPLGIRDGHQWSSALCAEKAG